MLGISRQGVHDLVRRGKLPRHPDGGVPSLAVRDRLQARFSSGAEPAGGLRMPDDEFLPEQPPTDEKPLAGEEQA
jgi:hypothetical protein